MAKGKSNGSAHTGKAARADHEAEGTVVDLRLVDAKKIAEALREAITERLRRLHESPDDAAALDDLRRMGRTLVGRTEKGRKRRSSSGAPTREPRAVLMPRDFARIRTETMLDERVIRAWADGRPVRESTVHAIQLACDKLGIEICPPSLFRAVYGQDPVY